MNTIRHGTKIAKPMACICREVGGFDFLREMADPVHDVQNSIGVDFNRSTNHWLFHTSL